MAIVGFAYRQSDKRWSSIVVRSNGITRKPAPLTSDGTLIRQRSPKVQAGGCAESRLAPRYHTFTTVKASQLSSRHELERYLLRIPTITNATPATNETVLNMGDIGTVLVF